MDEIIRKKIESRKDPAGDLRQRYQVTCCACGSELYAMPSIDMKAGINSGSIDCPDCGTVLHLKISPDLAGSHMVSSVWGRQLVANERMGPS